MEIKPLWFLFIYYWFFYLIYLTQATGCKEEMGQGTRVILKLTFRADVNVKIMFIYYLNSAWSILFDTCIDIDMFFHYIISLWKHYINVRRLIWSSVVMIESEKSWKHVSICVLESYNYKFTVWLKRGKVKLRRK